MTQIKVTVTSPRTTTYQRARRTAEVLLTDRVRELVENGTLILVGHGTTYVDSNDQPVRRVQAPTKSELVVEAEGLGVEVRPSWSKPRLQEEIQEAKERGEADTSPGDPGPIRLTESARNV